MINWCYTIKALRPSERGAALPFVLLVAFVGILASALMMIPADKSLPSSEKGEFIFSPTSASLLTIIQAPDTHPTSIGVRPSEFQVSTFLRVIGLLGKYLERSVLRPNKPVKGVGKALADP